MITADEQRLIDDILEDVHDPQSDLNRLLTVETEVQDLIEKTIWARQGRRSQPELPACRTKQKLLFLVGLIVDVVVNAGWIE